LGSRTRRPGGRAAITGLAAGGGLIGLVAGCGASQSSGTAAQQPAAHPSSSAPVTAEISRADLKALAVQYLAIAKPANHRLEVENDGFGDNERDDLAQAKKDLRAEVATERRFDEQLLQIRFPSPIAMTARALVRFNQVRIALTESQSRATSLASLRSFDDRHKAADAAVETQARLIRVFLRLPPPSTS
jgi:hypothetical protein